MISGRLREVIDEMIALSPEEQDRLAAAIQTILRHPPITSDEVWLEVMTAFEEVMDDSQPILDYLRDKKQRAFAQYTCYHAEMLY